MVTLLVNNTIIIKKWLQNLFLEIKSFFEQEILKSIN